MEKKFITPQNIRALHESIGFLNNYTGTPGEAHHVGPDIHTVMPASTELLEELAQVNTRRNEIIELLMMDAQPKSLIGNMDIHGKKISLGSIVDIHQTVNGCRTFMVTDDREVRYYHDDKPGRVYEYDVEELLDVNKDLKTIEIIN